jgi:1-aminocyclopropane-1-carboxylate deaminase
MFTDLFDTTPSILQELLIPDFTKRGIKLFVKRDDLIHKDVSGNKWRKLKYNLLQVAQGKYDGIFTFGGAYSNHLVATASVANKAGIPVIGFVRGEELNPNSNETLQKCHQLGMKLIFLTREEYGMRNDKQYIDEIKMEYPNYYFVPEGGGNYLGMVGCQEIWNELPKDINHLFVAQGTTTTSCGLLLGKPSNTKLHVVPVLKGFDVEGTMMHQLRWFVFQDEFPNDLMEDVIVHPNYHFGGYGKYSEELLMFIKEIYTKHQLPLDPVYTGKAFFALLEELKNPQFDNTSIVFVHTGGLQGSKSIEEKEGISLYENS